MASIRLKKLSQTYGSFEAVSEIDLEIAEGEFFSLLGPSGSGKTTLLRLIAGFEPPSHGEVWIGDENVTTLPPEKRRIGMVFQNYALFPHLNVFENVAYGLRALRADSRAIRASVEESLTLVDLEGFQTRDVHSLSGGQQQRVALARAIAPHPRVLLMDEPLSNLDARLRLQTRQQIRDLQRRLGMTTVYVTHDQSEALSLSDRLAILLEGKLRQTGSPEEIYTRPVSLETAVFLGEMNLIKCRVSEDSSDSIRLILMGQEMELPRKNRPRAPEGYFDNKIKGTVEAVEFEGDRWRLMLDAAGERIRINWPVIWLESAPSRGDGLVVSIDSDRILLFGPSDKNG